LTQFYNIIYMKHKKHTQLDRMNFYNNICITGGLIYFLELSMTLLFGYFFQKTINKKVVKDIQYLI
jgi:hypothetical protein